MQTIYLMGAENVARAGHQLAAAASEMSRAAASMEETLHRHRQMMDDWLNRLEQILKEAHERRA